MPSEADLNVKNLSFSPAKRQDARGERGCSDGDLRKIPSEFVQKRPSNLVEPVGVVALNERAGDSDDVDQADGRFQKKRAQAFAARLIELCGEDFSVRDLGIGGYTEHQGARSVVREEGLQPEDPVIVLPPFARPSVAQDGPQGLRRPALTMCPAMRAYPSSRETARSGAQAARSMPRTLARERPRLRPKQRHRTSRRVARPRAAPGIFRTQRTSWPCPPGPAMRGAPTGSR